MINGIINVYKEPGFTSHDVVAKLRGILKTKKIGHTGTLDPDAEGVLPVCIGNATKLCELLTDKTKEYQAGLLLGTVTDTQDTSGTIIGGNNSWKELSTKEIRQAVLGFTGVYSQIPPMYSALKVNGKKLYELAREGIEVERKPRNVEIYNIEIVSMEIPRAELIVRCSKGTYIRTLCHDIGSRLGCGGCMASLVRNAVGRFHITDSHTLSEIEELWNEGRFFESGILLETEKALEEYPVLKTMPHADKLVRNGNVLAWESFSDAVNMEAGVEDGQWFRIHDSSGRFLAVYEYQKRNRTFKSNKMFCCRQMGRKEE
ncbi:MAG: tRNA pseudouridine(55) synthase TruB [Lachnospiraceae bacterium]|nr:tRNA pseudouridine(55) synthase TruB [Lachnospiraceae bacterium]